ncbi:hypothetical protein EHJ13_14270 [Cronobacter dublinensis]|uniref:Uncharacterized protein n=1 Tax=Cronobacter dublinensis TaxID=413497 RepID=A0A9Q4T1T2_9ENTR|nr:hypothetical protein [Cronobacter dublinensis]
MYTRATARVRCSFCDSGSASRHGYGYIPRR